MTGYEYEQLARIEEQLSREDPAFVALFHRPLGRGVRSASLSAVGRCPAGVPQPIGGGGLRGLLRRHGSRVAAVVLALAAVALFTAGAALHIGLLALAGLGAGVGALWAGTESLEVHAIGTPPTRRPDLHPHGR